MNRRPFIHETTCSKRRAVAAKVHTWARCLILILLTFYFSGIFCDGHCGTFDSDDETIEAFDADTGDASLFDADEVNETDGIFQDTPPMESAQKRAEAAGPVTQFLKDATFTLGYQVSYATDADAGVVTNFSFLRQEYETLFAGNLFVRLDGKLVFIPENDHRAEAEETDFLLDGHIRELYLQAGYDDVSIKLGNQIVVWGQADTAAVTDVVSPRDLSDFVFLDLEDARFGQFMLSADIYLDILDAFFFISPFPDTDTEPDNGTRYFRAIPGRDRFELKEDEPEFGDLEYGMRLSRKGLKTELSVMAGRFYANSPVYDMRVIDPKQRPRLDKLFSEYDMIGGAASHALQSILLKFEVAGKNEFPLQGVDAGGQYVVEACRLLDTAAGLEYNANDRYLITLELFHRHVYGRMKTLRAADRDSASLYATFIKDFLNDTLEFEYSFYYHFQDRNRFHDFQLTYDLTDAIQFKTAYAFFDMQDQDSLLWQYRDEDRVTFEVNLFF